MVTASPCVQSLTYLKSDLRNERLLGRHSQVHGYALTTPVEASWVVVAAAPLLLLLMLRSRGGFSSSVAAVVVDGRSTNEKSAANGWQERNDRQE